MKRRLLSSAFVLGVLSNALFANAAQVSMRVDGEPYRCDAGQNPNTDFAAVIHGQSMGCIRDEQSNDRVITTRCECRSNNGPDLIQIGFSMPPYSEKWETKIDGWNNSDGNWQNCFQRARVSPACVGNDNYRVGRRCECINNNGPDLYQIGYDTLDGSQLWRVKTGGWNTGEANWRQCWDAIQNDPACH